jgi:hypothetical protein
VAAKKKLGSGNLRYIQTRVSPEIDAKVREFAKRDGITMAAWLRRLVVVRLGL